jgi:hypothetical protein
MVAVYQTGQTLLDDVEEWVEYLKSRDITPPDAQNLMTSAPYCKCGTTRSRRQNRNPGSRQASRRYRDALTASSH